MTVERHGTRHAATAKSLSYQNADLADQVDHGSSMGTRHHTSFLDLPLSSTLSFVSCRGKAEMKMTFVALAKSLGHAFSSSSSSSAASSSGSRQRPPVSATPSHEHKSNKSSLSDNGWSSADAEKDAKQVAEELGVSPQDELKTVAIPTDMPKETPGDEAEDGEDMDIASSRASSPAPIVVSRDSLDDASSDGVPYTPPPAQPLELADEPSTSVLLGKVDVERSRYELPEPSLDKKSELRKVKHATIG